MGWLIFLAILAALNCLPLGGRIRFDGQNFSAGVLIGKLPIRLYPLSDWLKRKMDRPKKEKPKKPQTAPPAAPRPEEKPAQPKGDWKRFLPLIPTALDFLGSLRRKLRLNELTFVLTMAGDDPADLAQNYGRAWVALGNLMPLIDRAFVIKKRNLDIRCDFCGEETTVSFAVDLTITVGRIVSLLVVYGIRMLKQFLSLKKAVATNE